MTKAEAEVELKKYYHLKSKYSTYYQATIEEVFVSQNDGDVIPRLQYEVQFLGKPPKFPDMPVNIFEVFAKLSTDNFVLAKNLESMGAVLDKVPKPG